jgi:acyl carrier protein
VAAESGFDIELASAELEERRNLGDLVAAIARKIR